jgi:hypothetical protein
MKTPLAKCNKCERLWVDTNPQVGQKKFELEMEDYPALEEEDCQYMLDGFERNDYRWNCPLCKTDGYLVDFEGEVIEIRDDDGLVVRYKERK